ncbi:hypothetical protein H2248_006277 [Termitomyces sp. 'cryptogamus']|nr:hypothetical protein H2248_006277 [Termitomyces sp. 'cryptogamus']
MSKSPAPKPGKLTLYSNHLSPNGLKVSIYLEELRAKEPALFESVTLERVDLSTGMHKQPSFLKLNPNGRIPILVDHNADDFPVFESAAILLYLEQNYDKKKAFSFDAEKSPKEYSSILQWIFFAVRSMRLWNLQSVIILSHVAWRPRSDARPSPLLPALLCGGCSFC